MKSVKYKQGCRVKENLNTLVNWNSIHNHFAHDTEYKDLDQVFDLWNSSKKASMEIYAFNLNDLINFLHAEEKEDNN